MRKISLFIVCIFFVIAGRAQTWPSVTSGTVSTLQSCSFGNASTVYAVGGMGFDSATILKSVDGGVSFYHLSASFLSAYQPLFSCYFLNADTGFIAGGTYNVSTSAYTSGFIYKTTNGGSSWSPVLTTAPTAFYSISFTSALVGYASGAYSDNGTIYKTTDGGNTWTSIFTGTSHSFLSKQSFVNDTTGFVVGTDMATHQAKIITIRGGVVYSNVDVPAYSGFNSVCFSSGSTGFVAASDTATGGPARVLKTTDGGTTWTAVYTSTAHYSGYTMKFANTSLGYLIGDANLMTTNGGATWSTFTPTTLGGSLYGMDFKSGEGVIVGEGGLILRTGSITEVPVTGNMHLQHSLCPNPSSSGAVLSFANDQEHTKIIISDMTGRQVRSYDLSGNTLDIARGELPSGVYLVNIRTADGNSAVEKMQIQ